MDGDADAIVGEMFLKLRYGVLGVYAYPDGESSMWLLVFYAIAQDVTYHASGVFHSLFVNNARTPTVDFGIGTILLGVRAREFVPP